MKQLLMNEVINKNIYLLLGMVLLINTQSITFEYKIIFLFVSLFVLFYLLKGNHKRWLLLINHKTQIRKIVFAKILISTLFSILICLFFSMHCRIDEIRFMYTLGVIYLNCFILYTYVIPDGYYQSFQVNVLQVYCVLFLYLCCIYHYEWWHPFISLSYYGLWITLINFSFTIIVAAKTIRKVYAHQVALSVLLDEFRFIQQVLFVKETQSILLNEIFFNWLNDKRSYPIFATFYVVILQLKYYLLILFVMILFELWNIVYLLAIIIFISIIIKTIECYKKLKK